MTQYNVTRIDIKTEEERDYGYMDQAGVKLVTRGYVQDKDVDMMYSRKNSRYIYMVTRKF